MHNTSKQYDEVIAVCRELFINKMKDYGPSWRILRPRSVTDQIFIKAKRIRTLELRETFSEPIERGPRQPFPHISLLYSSPKSVAMWLSAGDVEPDCQS